MTDESPKAERPSTRFYAERLVARFAARGPLAYTVALGVAVVLVTPSFLPFEALWEPAQAGMTAALLAGALLIVRMRLDRPGSSLLIVPVLVAGARLGTSTLPVLACATFVAALLRRLGPWAAVRLAAQEVLAFAIAHVAAETFSAGADPLLGATGFAIAFVTIRSVLAHLSWLVGSSESEHPHAERPDAALSLLIAPLSAVPVLAGSLLGDGALLLSLVALLTLLTVVCEAVNLASARAEAEIERDRWVSAFALQEELTQLITHEVRNPLTTILTYSDLASEAIRTGPEPSALLENHLERIRRAGKSIGRLADNLLQMSRLEGAAELPEAETIDPNALSRGVIAEMLPLAEQKDVALLLEAAGDSPTLSAPLALLQEALTNLVSNAVKYTPHGGSVTIWSRSGPNGAVTLGVTDTGVGLSEGDLARLFTRFFRSDDPRVRRERGAGLGLALTKSIVERMGGRLMVSSTLDAGSTFCIEMPGLESTGRR